MGFCSSGRVASLLVYTKAHANFQASQIPTGIYLCCIPNSWALLSCMWLPHYSKLPLGPVHRVISPHPITTVFFITHEIYPYPHSSVCSRDIAQALANLPFSSLAQKGSHGCFGFPPSTLTIFSYP